MAGGPNCRRPRSDQLNCGLSQEAPVPETSELELDVVPAIKSLAELSKAENACTRCPFYKDATGEGRRHAHLMLVGEQPGDKEDLAGKPFVGPAGQVLDHALAEADDPCSARFRRRRD